MAAYKIKWSDDLLIGDEYVDAQHKHLIELIGSIPEHDTARDQDVLKQAMDYAAKHFEDEEAYMTEIQYPNLDRQKKEHKKLTRTLKAYKKEFDNGETDLYGFKQFMFRWIRDHVMNEDKMIGEFSQSQGG